MSLTCFNIIVVALNFGFVVADVHLARADEPTRAEEPFLIGLRRESVPIYRNGKIASFKTSYSGILSVGTPSQEFRVVFDTGSGNIVLPAAECKSEACLVEHRRRFNMSASSTSVAVNEDGSKVLPNHSSDQVTIGFGTGEITGELARESVCFGSSVDATPPQEGVGQLVDSQVKKKELCVEMGVILAVEMSDQPFKTFRFDGILGLGLGGLAMSQTFSAFEMIMRTGLPAAHFGVFLSDGDEGEESEIAMGGVDSRRLLEPLHWAPVAMPELGYWQVQIKAIRVDGHLLDVCRDGSCRGVVDTGTSHLGVPAPFDKELSELLVRDAGDTLDCRLVAAPEVEIELQGYNLTLRPANYMRRLPLREGISVSSAQGVFVPSAETNATLEAPSSADPVGAASNLRGPEKNGTITGNKEANAGHSVDDDQQIRRFCSPRLMPVRLPRPLGPKLFILGEPVLHRYYTVYDWANRRVGFGLSNTRRNLVDPSQIVDRRGALPEEVDMLLMQERVTVTRKTSQPAEVQDEIAMVQVTVTVSVRAVRV